MSVTALHTAATGLRALSTSLDVTANNLANANNDGFKSSRAVFEDLFYEQLRQPGTLNSAGDVSPIGTYVGLGTKVAGTELSFEQGNLVTTNNPLDVAIQGKGFFQVKIPGDQGDGLGYTRAGHFFLDKDGNIVVNGSEGYKLEPPIQVPANATGITIGSDGRTFWTMPGQTDPQEGPQIQLARFANPQGLKQIGGNLFQTTGASGQAVLGVPGTDGLGKLQQNAVEASNVDPVKELVDLIKTQRTFEMNSQSIQAADQMMQQIGNLRR